MLGTFEAIALRRAQPTLAIERVLACTVITMAIRSRLAVVAKAVVLALVVAESPTVVSGDHHH